MKITGDLVCSARVLCAPARRERVLVVAPFVQLENMDVFCALVLGVERFDCSFRGCLCLEIRFL